MKFTMTKVWQNKIICNNVAFNYVQGDYQVSMHDLKGKSVGAFESMLCLQ